MATDFDGDISEEVVTDTLAENGKQSDCKFRIIEGGDGESFREVSTDELKKYIQLRLSETAHLSVLLGSGSSLPAIPQMKTTFAEYKSKNPAGLRPLLRKYTENPKHDPDNIETFLSWIESRINGLSNSEIRKEKQIYHDVEKRLISSISKGFLDDYNEVEKRPDNSDTHNTNQAGKTELTYETFMRRLAKLRESSRVSDDAINVFTTNYDLFVENSLDRLNYSYTDGFRHKLRPEFNIAEYSRRPVDVARRFRDRWSPVSPFFKVYKLHGSINWLRSGKSIVRSSDWDLGNSVVIAPTSSKYADTQGSPFSDLFRELSVELLKPNTTLIVNGFGFGDEHINELLRQALSRDDFAMTAFVNNREENVKAFMNKVSGNPKATFITNGEGNSSAHYFSTLASLLAFEDPFENHDSEAENGK
ncbi:MAG: SIR2 family protein [Lacticaseibacillus paracasei]|jgi:hypothetical protein|uniref:SIR2 family protein n=1 Tax=Lacticaseibacillus mingshuiensis TaxID=2799574 RepID=A0ABW4CIX7_9LACO|nr:SIR2 family protein [Lacticaseibacillus mingshuiensis]